MKRFKTFITETHYEDIYPQSFADFRKKYMKIDNKYEYYIQFTVNDSKDDKTPYDNPDHNDPVGIYAYPLQYVLKNPADIWYGSKAKYLRVLKRGKTKTVDLTYLNQNEAENIIYKMGFLKGSGYYPEDVMKLYKKIYGTKGKKMPIGRMFLGAVQLDMTAVPELSKGIFSSTTYPIVSNKEQTKRFLKAGYNCIEDRATSAEKSSLNDREPEQIVFLKRNAFKVIEVVPLRPEKKENNIGVTNNPQTFLSRKIAALIATEIGDKLLTGNNKTDGLMGNEYFWSVKGRRIEINFERPTEYYRSKDGKPIGYKKHKEDTLSTPHELTVKIHTEFGSLHRSYEKKEKFKDILYDIKHAWKYLLDNPIENDWEGEDQKKHKKKEEIETQKYWAKQRKEKNEKALKYHYTDFKENLDEIGSYFNTKFNITTDEDKLRIMDVCDSIVNLVKIQYSEMYHSIEKEEQILNWQAKDKASNEFDWKKVRKKVNSYVLKLPWSDKPKQFEKDFLNVFIKAGRKIAKKTSYFLDNPQLIFMLKHLKENK